jgi:hypothetical protein
MGHEQVVHFLLEAEKMRCTGVETGELQNDGERDGGYVGDTLQNMHATHALPTCYCNHRRGARRFLCALRPEMRDSWADAWARHLKPGGTLIALAFPIEDCDRGGPPWPLQLSIYDNLLTPRGFKCVKADPVPEHDATVPDRAGREILTVWEKVQ